MELEESDSLTWNYTTGSFPGGPVVRNPPSRAGDKGSIAGRETGIPHAVQQLSLCTATTEPTWAHMSPTTEPQLEKPTQNEKNSPSKQLI